MESFYFWAVCSLKAWNPLFCVSGSLLFCLQIPLKTCFPVWITWALGCSPLENSDFGYHREILFSVIVGKRLYLGTREKQHSQKLLCQCKVRQVDFGLLTPLKKKGYRGVYLQGMECFSLRFLLVVVCLTQRKRRPQSLSFFLWVFVYKSLSTYIQRYANNILGFGFLCNLLILIYIQKEGVSSNTKSVSPNT